MRPDITVANAIKRLADIYLEKEHTKRCHRRDVGEGPELDKFEAQLHALDLAIQSLRAVEVIAGLKQS